MSSEFENEQIELEPIDPMGMSVDTVIDEDNNVIAGEPLPEEPVEESFYANLAEKLDDKALAKIGNELVSDYEQG
jgi:hypothetical protein